ncbi:response regulator [Enterococcus sp. LJL120]
MRNMLLVDDQREERNGIKYLIEKFNFPIKTYEAANGLEALEILQSQKIDILLTDVKMPLMDGIALVSQVNQDFPQVIRIIFSSYGEFDYAKGAMEANVRYYLLKPIEIEEFAKVINEALKELATRELKEKNQSQEELTRSLSRLFMNSKIGNWPLQISSILDEYLQEKQLQLLELDFPTELTEPERSMVIKQFDQFKEASKFYVKIDNKTLFILLVSTKKFVKERVRDFASRSIIHLKQTQKIYPRIIVMEEVDQLPLFLRKLTKLEKYHREFLLAQNQLYPETEIEEYKEDRRPFDIHLEACLNAIGRKENHELAAAFSQLAKLIDRQVILTTSLAQ